MEIEDFANKLIEKSKKLGATDADVLVGGTEEISSSVRFGKLEDIERSVNKGFGLRVFVGKKSAIISSSKFEDAEELAQRAVAMAKESTEDEFSGLADSELLARDILELDLLDNKEPSAEELLDRALEAENAALENDKISNSEGANANYSKYETLLVTSNGFAKNYQASHSAISVSLIAGEGSNMQTDYDYSSARHASDLKNPDIIGREAAARTVKKLNPKKVKSGKYPIIFEPRMAKSLLSDLAKGINGASIARGTSFLKNKMGEQIFAKNINIIDNPNVKRGLASRPYDGEAVKTEKLKVIEDGVLQSWLLDLRSANKLGLKTTGHASRGASSPPSPTCSNLYMEAGDVLPEEMIKNIKAGLLVTESFGMGINYTTGDYSQGAGGFWIENGEIAYPVNEITLASNLLDIFANLQPANDLEMRYGINSPTVFIPEMTIAGT